MISPRSGLLFMAVLWDRGQTSKVPTVTGRLLSHLWKLEKCEEALDSQLLFHTFSLLGPNLWMSWEFACCENKPNQTSVFRVFVLFLAVRRTSFLKNQIVVLEPTIALNWVFIPVQILIPPHPAPLPHSFHSLDLPNIGLVLPNGF